MVLPVIIDQVQSRLAVEAALRHRKAESRSAIFAQQTAWHIRKKDRN